MCIIFKRATVFISFSVIATFQISRKYLLNYNNFDGVLFQTIYVKFHGANNECGVIEPFEEDYVNKVFKIVTSNGNKVKTENDEVSEELSAVHIA